MLCQAINLTLPRPKPYVLPLNLSCESILRDGVIDIPKLVFVRQLGTFKYEGSLLILEIIPVTVPPQPQP
jgi:hypothetical protein